MRFAVEEPSRQCVHVIQVDAKPWRCRRPVTAHDSWPPISVHIVEKLDGQMLPALVTSGKVFNVKPFNIRYVQMSNRLDTEHEGPLRAPATFRKCPSAGFAPVQKKKVKVLQQVAAARPVVT
jgi:hypothetical protein